MTTRRRTMPGQKCLLTGHVFWLPVILISHIFAPSSGIINESKPKVKITKNANALVSQCVGRYLWPAGAKLMGGMGGGGGDSPPNSRFRRAQGKFAGKNVEFDMRK